MSSSEESLESIDCCLGEVAESLEGIRGMGVELRERAAIALLAGILANPNTGRDMAQAGATTETAHKYLAVTAVRIADALLAELNKETDG